MQSGSVGTLRNTCIEWIMAEINITGVCVCILICSPHKVCCSTENRQFDTVQLPHDETAPAPQLDLLCSRHTFNLEHLFYASSRLNKSTV